MIPPFAALVGRTAVQALIWCAAWKGVEVASDKVADTATEFMEKRRERRKPKRGRPKGSRNKPKTA